MYFLQNYLIWIRKILIRILLKEYPNHLLEAKAISKKNSSQNVNLVSSTENLWVSTSMFKKWRLYKEFRGIDLNIYSNKKVNAFMNENYKDDLIYEIYQKSLLPVQKIDLFRICCIYFYGGIWLDIKSEINLGKVLKLYEKSNGKGILMYEKRKIEVFNAIKQKEFNSYENVIHNGFFCLPPKSPFLKHIISKIKKDYLYFQDIYFKFPKQAIMNLTGPHQFTRSFYDLNDEEKPHLCSSKDVGWIYFSKYAEFVSPLKKINHYSTLRQLKTMDSNIRINLE